MTQLARAGEPLPTAQTELPLQPRAPVGVIRLRVEERRPAAAEELGDRRGDTES
jgi:hypothetical protein